MAAELASLVLKMSADSAQLRTDIKRVQRDMTGMRKSAANLEKGFSGVSRTLKSTFSVLGVGIGIRGIVRSLDNLTASLDKISKTATKVGVTTDELQELRFAAGQAGVETRTLDMALQRFSRRLGEAAQGSGELKGTLEGYNIAVRDSEGNTRSVVDVLGDFANVIRTAESDQERLRIAFKAFDSEGAALVNMLRDGSSGLDQMRGRARELGLVIDGETIQASVDFRDSLNELKGSFTALQAEAIGPLLPKLIEYVEGLRDSIREGGGVKQVVDEMTASLEKLAKISAVVAATLFGFSRGGPLGAAILGGGTALTVFQDDIARLLADPRLKPLLDGEDPLEQFRGLGAGVPAITVDTGAGRPKLPTVLPRGGEDEKPADPRPKQIAAIIASLREEAETYGLTAEQIALYKLEQLGASDAQLAMAKALTAKVGLLRDEDEAMEASRQAADEWAEATHQARLADQALLVELADEIRLLGLSARERAQDEAARRLSTEATDEQREAVRALAGGLFDLTEAARENADQMSAFAEQAARNMQDAFAEFLFDPFQGGLDGMLLGLVDTLRRMASEAIAARIFESLGAEEKLKGILGAGDDAAAAAAQQAAAAAAAATLATGGATTGTAIATGATTGAGALTAAGAATAASIVAGAQAAAAMLTAAGAAGGGGGGGGGAFGAIGSILSGLFHSGGIAGQASAHRSLSALAFAGAPRFHSGGIAGIGADEVPAVLRRGEEVLTANDPRHRNNFGSEAPVVNIKNINAFDGQTVRDEMSTAAGERLILNVVSRNKRLLGIA